MIKNEFGYIDTKEFETCDDEVQKLAIINEEENIINVKTQGFEKFNPFTFEALDIYAVDSKLSPITLFNVYHGGSEFSAIMTISAKAHYYAIGKPPMKNTEKIIHLKRNSIINKIKYYNDDLYDVFIQKNIIAQKTSLDNGVTKEIEIKGEKLPVLEIGIIEYQGKEIVIELERGINYNHSKNSFKVSNDISLNLLIEEGIEFTEVENIIRLIDSTMHLFTLKKSKHNDIYVYSSDNIYKIINKKYYNQEFKKTENEPITRKDIEKGFISILQKIIELSIDSKNAIFPFLYYNRPDTYIEIEFLEYYRLIEFMDLQRQKRRNKGKNNSCMNKYVKKYTHIREKLFEFEDNQTVAYNLRALRNHYSHEGYYDDWIPVPQDDPKRYRRVDSNFKFNMTKLIKIMAYLEIYSECGIKLKNELALLYIL